jgi:hypothetical protein
MKLPTRIKVGHFVYRVERWRSEGEAGDRWGECDHGELVIRLRPVIPGTQLADTLIHEILHAIHNVWGLRVGDDEERIVAVTATALLTVFRDNPKLLAWLGANLKGEAK